jgi:cell division septation protein DedD
VQVGSFGEAANADGAAAKLRAAGWDARVKVGNTSDGTMIHRVQIGYFTTRQQAEAFIAQNRKDLAGAIAVHR